MCKAKKKKYKNAFIFYDRSSFRAGRKVTEYTFRSFRVFRVGTHVRIRRTNVPAVGRKLKRLTIVYLAPSKRIGLV